MTRVNGMFRVAPLAAMLMAVADAGAAATGASAAVPASEVAPKRLKVLMIGNSFSVCLLKEMPALAKELGLGLDLCSLYIGGCSLERHAENIKAPETNPYDVAWSYTSVERGKEPIMSAIARGPDGKGSKGNIPSMLVADKWDVVTIQQASHQSWKPESYEPFGTEVLDVIARLAPQAKVYVQQTWSYTPWDGRLANWGIDQNEMFSKLEAAYASFAAAHSLPIIRTGEAVQLYRAELPVVYGERSNNDVCGTDTFEEKDGVWKHVGDPFHFNSRGHYLQALVWVAKLYGADVTKATAVPKSLADTPECATLMREIAMRVAK